jgi:hypothetical protein
MKITILFISFILGLSSSAQSINSQYRFGGSQYDYISTLVFHQETNSYFFVGQSLSTNNDRVGQTYGLTDTWLVKLDSNKELIWEKSYGGSGSEFAEDILIKNNTIYILSSSNSTNDGNKTSPYYGDLDLWLLALDLDGNILWQQSYGGLSSEINAKIISLPNENLLISSISYSGISGNKTSNIISVEEEPWLIEIHSSDGGIVKQKSIESPVGYQNCTIQVDPFTNELYFLMPSVEGLYGEKTDEGYGGFDLWLTKLDENLNVTFNKCFGGLQEDGTYPSLLFTQDNIYLVCTTKSSNSGNKTSPINGTIGLVNGDYWLLKLTRDFDIIWDKSFGGEGNDIISGIIKGNGNSIMLYGSSGSQISGNKTAPRHGDKDYWTLIIDSNDGAILEQNSYGGLEEELVAGALVNENQDVLLYGFSYSGISGNKTLPSYGENDIWILELETTSLLKVKTLLDEKNVAFYPNPFTESLKLDLHELNEDANLTIYTLDGQKVHEAELKANSIYVWNTDLASQVFIYQLTSSEGKTITGKLVKL